jgi:hypothetical protein
MKSVRQVSMVERDVADTVRVTERPKKLNPLEDVMLASEVGSMRRDLPDTDHDQNTGDGDGSIRCDLSPSFNNIEISVSTCISPTNDQVQDDIAEKSNHESKETLPAYNLEGLQSILVQDVLFQHELRRSEDLSTSDEENADNRPDSLWCPSLSCNDGDGFPGE